MECKYSYIFTEKAECDLDEILHYISVDLDNPIAAQNIGRRIFEQIAMACSFPNSGAVVENEYLSDKMIRKLIVDNYIIYYKAFLDEEIISVIRIVYGKRNIDELLKSM